ncbi:MAG: deoxyribodipyrimidine photo-lyase [Haloferacaceae archaeon]
MQIHWHRRDLRVADNRALAVAAGRTEGGDDVSGPLLPVFVLDDEVLAHASPPRVRFVLDALAALRDRYRDLGSGLVVVRGDPREVLPSLADEHGAERVVWNRDYSGLARERDAAVREALADAGVARASFHDHLHHEPGSITTADGDPYSVFSYFGEKWLDREKADPYPAPAAADLADVAGDPLPSMGDLGFADPEAEIPPAGPVAARERLDDFCADAIFRYERDREYPAREGTSRLSTDLKWGTVGVREVYAATADAMAEATAGAKAADGAASDDEGGTAGDDEAANGEVASDDDASDAVDSVETFRTQLAWREFYANVLAFHPETVTENYDAYENPIEWREDPEGLQAWKDGETGYPIVDAGMRQLRREAFVHNRVRMVVASFLTKDLLVDWREGYAWFREKLADHDTANDVGGWQWAASTGTDAQPYFRIFNPTTQGERYDPDAAYIREYVPELRGVDPEVVHGWPDLAPERRREVAPDYPGPIVDHAERREAALNAFERARGED